MKKGKGYLVLESGDIYSGTWWGGTPRAGEVVFNTAHVGYEEMSTDPSYFSQILVMTAPMQGNYGTEREVWESRRMWIEGFICLEIQESSRDGSWVQQLTDSGIPTLTGLDTRELVMHLREGGTTWGALVNAANEGEAREQAETLIREKKNQGDDWAFLTTRENIEFKKGQAPEGPRVAVIDFGCKENILRELSLDCSELAVFPSRTSPDEIRKWNPDGIFLSNGPGDPEKVEQGVETTRELLGWKPLWGICMGHQILSQALGAKTFKLKFGHRGGNHPIKDHRSGKIYMTSQNHGYAVDPKSLPKDVVVTHTNLNDQTVSGISCDKQKCWSVQFHPECHPGPRDARTLFKEFIGQLR